MRTTYSTMVKDISDVNNKLLCLIRDTEKKTDLPDPGFSDWKSVCTTTEIELQKATVRIAVVGAIKSGKSTLVNSIFEKDYLKRGAGVLTSIVTRVRNSYQDRATLFLKNWEKINQEINQAIILLPTMIDSFNKDKLDIRQQKDRDKLELAMSNLGYEQLITNNTLNTSVALVSSYLKGYDQIQHYIDTKNSRIELTKKKFCLHHDFIANDNLAVYMEDALLEIQGKNPGSNIEIADCQGSDSLNPLHLSMIQDYLNVAHLIIYVISSRTGIRQADIKFLTIIKKMGILENTIFVLNSDLNEHDSLKDLKKVLTNVKENLFFICQSNCQIFTFSALLNLSQLTSKTQGNKILWNAKPDTIEFSIKEHELFQKTFKNKVNYNRYFFLTNNPIKKLEIVSKSTEDWIKFNQIILEKNTTSANQLVSDLNNSRIELLGTKSNIERSIVGMIEQVKKDFFIEIDRFFGSSHDGLTSNITRFIRSWNFNFDNLNMTKTEDLTANLHKIFHDFKQSLENYITYTINPKIIRFVQHQELKLTKRIEALSEPYFLMFRESTEKHNKTISKLNLNLEIHYKAPKVANDLNSIRNPVKLSPLILNLVQFPANIKTKVLLNFGFSKITHHLLRFFCKTYTPRQNIQLKAIKKTVANIKKETEGSISFHLKNYKENIKFQHVVHLAQEVSYNLKQQIFIHLNANTMELAKLGKLIRNNREEKRKILKSLSHMRKNSNKINERLQQLANISETQKPTI